MSRRSVQGPQRVQWALRAMESAWVPAQVPAPWLVDAPVLPVPVPAPCLVGTPVLPAVCLVLAPGFVVAPAPMASASTTAAVLTLAPAAAPRSCPGVPPGRTGFSRTPLWRPSRRGTAPDGRRQLGRQPCFRFRLVGGAPVVSCRVHAAAAAPAARAHVVCGRGPCCPAVVASVVGSSVGV